MSSHILKAIGYNCKITTIKYMMHTTKMTATGCETIERKRMIGKCNLDGSGKVLKLLCGVGKEVIFKMEKIVQTTSSLVL